MYKLFPKKPSRVEINEVQEVEGFEVSYLDPDDKVEDNVPITQTRQSRQTGITDQTENAASASPK